MSYITKRTSLIQNDTTKRRLIKMLKWNKKGDMFAFMVNLLFLVMMLAVFVSLIPALNAILNISQQSDNLNCYGYLYNGDANSQYSYNDSLPSNTIACLAVRLYLPYIALAVLIGGVSKLMADRVSPL
jgi:hypothetical protein